VAALRARLARAEREWLRGRGGGASAAASASASAWLRAYAATVVGNVRLSLTNVHIRYEHATSPGPGAPLPREAHPLAAGVTLGALRAITVDASGAETFATAGALERVRKARRALAFS
jgi:vacuolar protein sorting-associated protein 13A/C